MKNEIATPRVDEVDCARAPDTNGHEGWKMAYFAMLTHARTLEREREIEQRKAGIAQASLGNIFYHWEQLPNDISTDPGMDSLNNAMKNALSMLKENFSPDKDGPKDP